MIPKITHCRSLTYKYDTETGICTFEDGTEYTLREMIFIARQELTDEDMDALHAVKKVFDGELDTGARYVARRVKRRSSGRLSSYNWLSVMGRTLPPPEIKGGD